ncbi:MAG: phosphoenolpyruvate carboxykinase (ATP) [Gammaproteobacteria bacterium]|nr:phosphoenolpyruvate carboxykinase (ATP) [Gammaproteobacteria bacterium]
MEEQYSGEPDRHGLAAHGLTELGEVHWNLSVPVLYEHALRRHEGVVAADGPLVVHSGRSANDKFIVREPSTDRQIRWGKVNRPLIKVVGANVSQGAVPSILDREFVITNNIRI